ncbi:beta-ketoacyl synthase N-terminal-like domain-containing protein [Altibacter sp.]|uniref:beta-ketoacyl synthase N-terminal-like domain-containing protein n=1 Tax=Altibacter sp. TaxID=2024823 RepID=UPI000C8EE6B1|nr:beta-ketoacyl synthase N-terminal-like domain-containing protein [Altibacter sp.]MAP53622.1 beta-ketoacyl synthase [Altibacter sp.]
MEIPISISGIASVSALGSSSEEVWQRYRDAIPLFTQRAVGDSLLWVSEVASETEQELQALQQDTRYKKVDRSVLLAILAARKAVLLKHFSEKNTGINIGSSRGATQLFEDYHSTFLKEKAVSAYASPTTTLGNISSWVGQDLGAAGVRIEHSVTCSTALHALLNGIAWLQAGMADAFVVGGSEAALTPFTFAQMQALRLYSASKNKMACESMRLRKTKNTMVLGEGAAIAVIEAGTSERTRAVVKGYGFASEIITHNSSISKDANCFQQSMRKALQKASLESVDCIVMHAPGTVQGDTAEYNAIRAVFKEQLPLLTSNKWLVGHTFAASGMLSLELAVMMLEHNRLVENPFFANRRHAPTTLKSIMINAVGFGGNAVSIIISKP